MSQHRHRDDRRDDAVTPLGDDDARFLARVAESYAPPEPSAADRARFRAGLEAKLARRSRRAAWPWLVPAAAALAAVLVVTLFPRTEAPAPSIAETPTGESLTGSEEETLLALVTGESASDDDALPEDYQAIASLMY